MEALLETYQLERSLAPKHPQHLLMMKDDNTYDTALETSGSCSCHCIDNHDDDDDDSTSSQHDEIYDTSASSFDDDHPYDYDHDDYDSTSILLMDESDAHVFDTRYRDSLTSTGTSSSHSCSSDQQEELLPTFNAMITRSQSVVAENISAIGMLEKEQEIKLKHSQRPSALIQRFAKARVETFQKNLDFVQEEAEKSLRRSLSGTTCGRNCFVLQQSVELSEDEPKEQEEEKISTEQTEEEVQEQDDERPHNDEEEGQDDSHEPSKSFSDFVQDRVNTFSRNVDVIQAHADAWSRSFGDVLRIK